MSVRIKLALLCSLLSLGFLGIYQFAEEDAYQVLPEKVLMPPNLTCKTAIYSVSLDTIFVKVDSLVTVIESGVVYKLQRMPDDYCLAQDTLPSDSLRICCNDVGDTINILVTATDIGGSSNSCMTTVVINDKLPPILPEVLPDITVSCTFPFNFSRLDTFGRYIHPDSTSRTNEFENDQEVTDLHYFDFCSVSVRSTYADLRNCGTGTLERYFALTDLSGNITRDTQIIHIINTSPFTVANIIWPNDTTIILGPNQCIGANPPQNLGGEPIISGRSACVMPSVSKRDMVFNDPLSGCPYIMRTWRVIEMCTYRPNNGGVGSYERVQNIYIQDTIKPTFSPICKDTTFSDPDHGCEVLVNLTANAVDNCTEVDDILYSFSVTHDDNIILTGNTKTINHVFALGEYRVTWTIDDRCGNTNTCSHSLTVADIKPPTPLTNVSLVIGLPVACAVDLKASGFNVNSKDNCTPSHLLRYSFSADVNDTIRTLDCDDLGDNILEFWVTDLFGNQAKVNVNINVQDNNNHCPDNLVVKIDGMVMADDNVGLSEVKIILEGAEQQRAVMTDYDGSFSMSNLEANVSYFLTTNKSGEFLEGVNILDLIELQKDFYNIKKLETNRQKIAADINGDGIINHIDLSELRKIILGIMKPSENTPPWRVVDYSALAMTNPWPLKESFLFKDISKDEHLQLQAIKIGDIDGTAVRKLQTRNDGKIVWYYLDQSFVAGEKVTAMIHTSEDVPLTGIHLLLNYQSEVLTYKNTNGVNVNIGIDDLNPNKKGELKLCHINARGSNIRSESQVFTFEFVAKKAGKLSEVIELSGTESSYVVNAKDDLLYLNLVSFEPAEKVIFVSQNVPNPFDRYTSLSFEVKEDMPVEISILDQTGRKIHHQYDQYTKGRHLLEISDQQLGDLTGVFFVHIECAEVSEVRKILRVK
jgi:hypothetical protein